MLFRSRRRWREGEGRRGEEGGLADERPYCSRVRGCGTSPGVITLPAAMNLDSRNGGAQGAGGEEGRIRNNNNVSPFLVRPNETRRTSLHGTLPVGACSSLARPS